MVPCNCRGRICQSARNQPINDAADHVHLTLDFQISLQPATARRYVIGQLGNVASTFRNGRKLRVPYKGGHGHASPLSINFHTLIRSSTMQKVTSKLPSWDKTKTQSKKGFDKVWGWADKLGAPVNRLSNRIGSEAFWPTTLDKESDKAARILRSFCSEYTPSESH